MKMKFVKSCLMLAVAGLLGSSFAMAQEKAHLAILWRHDWLCR